MIATYYSNEHIYTSGTFYCIVFLIELCIEIITGTTAVIETKKCININGFTCELFPMRKCNIDLICLLTKQNY